MTATVRRRPWIAGLLSLVLPGLGQVYNGQAFKGLRWYVLLVGTTMILLAIMLETLLSPLSLVGSICVYLALYGTIVADAVKTARTLATSFQPKRYNRWYVYLTLLLIAPFVLHPAIRLPIRAAPVQAFRISSQSMQPTVLAGDHILVRPLQPLQAPLQRGTLIVFHPPQKPQRTFLKRIVALPGERVEIRHGQLLINGQPVAETYIHKTSRDRQAAFGPVVVPKKGDTIEIRDDAQVYLSGVPVPMPVYVEKPTPSGGANTGLTVFYEPLLPPGSSLQQPSGPFTVAHDYYFTLGDNRQHSRDSRLWGFVPDTQIQGVVLKIYWSWDHTRKRVRWQRIGTPL